MHLRHINTRHAQQKPTVLKEQADSPAVKSQANVSQFNFNQTNNSFDGVSKVAAHKNPVSPLYFVNSKSEKLTYCYLLQQPTTIDSSKLELVIDKLQQYVLNKEKCLDSIISYLE